MAGGPVALVTISGASMATTQSSPVNGATAASMLSSSWATPTCRSRPSASTTATPVWFFSPHARSKPNEVHTPTVPDPGRLPAAVSCVSVTVPNVLASRYASDEMVAIWSPEAKVVAERRLWLAVLRAQAELGVEVPEGVVADYERVSTTSTWRRSPRGNACCATTSRPASRSSTRWRATSMCTRA